MLTSAETLPGARVNCYIFEGLELDLNGASLDAFEEVLEAFSEKAGIKAVVKPRVI